MNSLIQFSRQRAARVRPLIEAGDRAASEPVILESGIESAKVAADVLHTLLVLSAKPPGSARLRIELEAPSVKGLENIPARLLLLGTNYSTTSDAGLALELRNLPAGTYTPVVYRTGCRTLFAAPVELKAGANVRVRWRLEAGEPEGNLVRNPDFRIRWSAQNRPEHWDYQAPKGGWVSDNIPVTPGKLYRAVVRAKVSVQWMQQTWQVLDKPVELTAPEITLTAPPAARYAKLIVAGREDPSTTLEAVALIGQ
jgi:hypothetical protein